MPRNQRRRAATAAAVTAGLFLAVTPPSIALNFLAFRGARMKYSGGSRTKSHSLREPRSAATWRKLTMDAGVKVHKEVVSGRHDAGVQLYSATSRQSVSGKWEKDSGGAGKDIAALVLSVLLLGSPRLGDTAAASSAVTQQEQLLSDLEQRLMNLPSGPPQTAETSSAPAEIKTDSEAEMRSRATREPIIESTMQPKSPTSPAPEVKTPLSASDVSKPPSLTTEAPPAPTITAVSPPVAKTESTPAQKRSLLVGKEQESLVRMQEYTFSVKLPELNVKFAPVAPITVPAEGSLFGGLSVERVSPLSNLPPPAVAVRDALENAGRGEGLQELMRSIGNFVPKQADYYRTVAELQGRVHSSVKDVENPAFAPGVPLSPEFTSMFSQAKEAVFSAMRPCLAKGVEPELALFMLATLPVITVALRAADEQSRRPMEPPQPLDYRPTRVVRYPNSPAKVDQKLIAEDRAQYAATAVTAPVVAAAASNVTDSVSTANLTRDVEAEAVVEDVEEKLRVELKRLRLELASATMLTGKVEALEKANARLIKQVAELSRPPSPEDIQRLAEKEAERARQEKEREEREFEMSRSIRERMAQVIAAREVLAESYPMPGPGTTLVQENDIEEEKVTAPPPPPAVLGNSAPATVADEGKGTGVLTGSRAAATTVTTPAAEVSSLTEMSAEGAEAPVATVGVGVPSGNNGVGSEKVGEELKDEDMAIPAASQAVVPGSDFDGASDSFSRALSGVQGFDLDALDLEMDDLRPEDLEELRKLEREMGDLDMASLEEEFDKEDDETITNALRIAAESAMAHTSGDGRRIRTASSLGAASSRSGPSRSNSGIGAEIGLGYDGGVDSPASQTEASVRGVGTAVFDEPLGEGLASEGLSSPVVTEGATTMRKLADEVMKEDGWRSLSASEVKRKTVAQLKGFLDKKGVDYPSKARKADLVALVCDSIAC